jgi:hypothetical protein
MKSVLSLLFPFFCVLSPRAILSAQTLSPAVSAASQTASRTLSGEIQTRKDGSMVHAMIRVEGAKGGQIIASSDDHGAFKVVLPSRISAPFLMIVQAPGFSEIRLPLNSIPKDGAVLTIQLDVEGVTASVTVNGESLPLEQDSPVISQLISGKTLDELPENGRNLSKLALLNPQVRSTGGIGSDAINGARLNVNADIFRLTRYTVDDSTDYEVVYGNAPLMALPISAIAEMKVLTNQYDTLFGGTTTGIIAYSTRAGGEKYHGEGAFFGRPSGLQAAPPVSTVRVPNRLLDGYGRIGGPLLDEKTRFFATYEEDSFLRGSFVQSPTLSVYYGSGNDFYGLVRVDRQLSPAQLLTARINADRTFTNNPNDRVAGIVQPSAGQTNRTQAIGSQLGLVSTFGSRVNSMQMEYVDALPYVLTPNQPSIGVNRPGYSTSGGSTALHLKNQTEDFRDVLEWTRGPHTLNFGVQGIRTQAHYISSTPFGTYTFASGAPTVGQQPTTYTQTFGTADIKIKNSYVAGFAQDTWHALSGLTLTLGARYEYQGLTGDKNNLAPRIGIAYDAFGNGRTILRGGFGYFYGEDYLQLPLNAYAGGVVSPTATYTFTAGQAGFPTYPNNLDTPPSGSLAKRDLYLLPQHLLNPYNMQSTLGVEQNLGRGWLLSVNGIHAMTRKQLSSINLNAPVDTYDTGLNVRTRPGQIAVTSIRPLSTYAGVGVNNIIQVQNGNSTAYDALRVDLLRHGGKRFDWNTSYIYAAALTYSVFQGEGTTGVPNDWYHQKTGEYGPTDFNQRHRSISYGTVHLPFSSHLTGVFTAATGLPVNPITGVDNNKDGYSNTDRPVGFSRDSLRGPKQISIDLSAGKTVALGEKLSVDLRADAFNLFNHGNFVSLNNVYGNGAAPASTFLGHLAGLSNADPGRQLQFGARLMF